MSTPERRRAGDPIATATTVALAVLALAPVLFARGFVLIGDMSFVPVQPWKGEWLGLDGSVPRAVPADAIVSVLTMIIPGDLVQKAVLLGALAGAAIGMLRLAGRFVAPDARWAPLGAAVLYLWNPWVLERLAIGHWGLLIGYAALPWVIAAALDVRRTSYGDLAALVVTVGIAASGSPTGGVAAGLVALVVTGVRWRELGRRIGLVVAGVLVVNLPWLLPGLLVAHQTTDPEGVQAFAARSDTPLGVLGSLLTFGGIWKSSIVPGERGSLLLVLLALGLTITGLVGLLDRARRDPTLRPVIQALLALAAVGFVLAALPTTGPGLHVATWLVGHVPGAGILRDSQKWLLLAVPAPCLGIAVVVEQGGRLLRPRDVPAGAIAAVAALLPVVLLPSLAWGIAGKLEPVRYPAEWSQVRGVLDATPAADRRTAVLPWATYRAFGWNNDRAALDPAIRFFPGQVVTDDALQVSATRTVAGEDPVAARIGAALATGAPLAPVLARAGIRYVLVEKTAGGDEAVIAGLMSTGTVLHDGHDLALLDLGHGRPQADAHDVVAIVTGDVLAGGAVLGCLLFMTLRKFRSKPVNVG